ncbi:MAG: T9SS type A sorting domain-containing protein [Bacteroidota bacterium]
MKGLKKISTFFFWCCLPIFSYGQAQYLLTNSNFDQTLESIYQTYEDQIGIDYNELYELVLPFVEGTVSNQECPAPNPLINEINQNFISFYWKNTPGAEAYRSYYINLETGASGQASSTTPSIAFDGLSGLNFFGFNSNCGGPEGPSGIIVADLAVLFPNNPPLGDNCLCVDSPLVTYPIDRRTDFPFFIPWPSDCDLNQYELSMSGELVFANSLPTPYNSLIVFQHIVETPQLIGLMSNCDRNAYSSPQSPNSVGHSPYYSVSFGVNGMYIYKGPILKLGEIALTRCRCARKGDTGFGDDNSDRSAELIPVDQQNLVGAPNPTTDQVNLSFKLQQSGPISLTVYDALGRQLQRVIDHDYREAGTYQQWVDLSGWPVGMYTFELLSTEGRESILVQRH